MLCTKLISKTNDNLEVQIKNKNILWATIFLLMSFFYLREKPSISLEKIIKIAATDPNTEELVPWEGEVGHVFFHPLIATPEKAFDRDKHDNFMHEWFVTKGEFDQILTQLHKKNYVLISIYDTVEFSEKNGAPTVKVKKPLVPKGKRPLVISIDDLNFYKVTTDNGGVQGLFVDEKGKLACSVKNLQEKTVVSYDAEVPLALEEFIKKHPDFSLGGARGVIAETGYNGYLGYLTNKPENPNRAADIIKAKAVADSLKSMGWIFAAHSMTHRQPITISNEKYKLKEEIWIKETTPLLGETKIFIFPFGIIPDANKMAILRGLGYKMFYGVGGENTVKIHKDTILAMRTQLDGLIMRKNPKRLEKFINMKEIKRDTRRRF